MVRVALALPLVAALMLLAGAHSADAAVTVRVLSPAQDSVTVGRAVTARVRVAGPVKGFRAVIRSPRGTRAVTDRFTQVRPGVWRGRLRVDRDLRPGRNHLSIRVRRPGGRYSVAVSHFVMATRPADLATRVPDRGAGPFRDAFRLRAGADFTARLDGRDVRDAFASRDGRLWRGDIRPRHGMRFGANRLRVVAFDATGRYEVLNRRRTLAPTAPLADAGADRIVHPRSVIRLDGTASRRRQAGPLEYRWRITAKPRGSRGRLVGAGGARPRLVGAAPGHYRVDLHVGDASAPARAGAARDQVELSVQQPQGPQGVPVQTIVDPSNPGIQVGGTFYPGAPGFGQILILDRSTLTPTRATTPNVPFPITDRLDELFEGIASQISDDQVVIVAGPGGPITGSIDPADVTFLETALQAFGSAGDQATIDALQAGGYTLIGIPGLVPGTAIENRGARQGTLPAGGVAGNFVTDLHSNYSFAWPASFTTFDTRAPGSTDAQNRVTVAGQTYVSDPVTNPYGGWQLVWLDADTLGPRGNFTYQNCFGASPCLDAMNAQLNAILADPVPGLVFLSSINNAQHTGRAAIATDGGILQAVGQFGGNESAFTVPGEYTLVGLAGLGFQGPNEGLDVNQAVAGAPSSRIAGLLRRNDQGLWQGGTSGTPGPTQDVTVWQPQLQRILAQPAQPFPALNTAGQRAAVRYIAAEVNLPSVSTAADVRALYWGDDDIQWSDKLALLDSDVPPCTQSPCAGSFAQVKQAFVTEWDDVATVRSYFTGGGSTDLDGIYSSAFGDSTLGFVAIADGVMSAYPAPPAQPARSPSWFSVLDSSLTLARGFTGFVPVVGGQISAALSVGQGAEDVYRAVTTTPGGAQALDPRVFEGDIFTFGSDLEKAWTAQISSLSHVADLLVSDDGRLTAAAASIQSTGPAGWGLDTNASNQITESLQASIAGYIWSSMLPVTTQVFTCIPEQRVPGTPALDQAVLTYFTSEQAGDQGGPPYQVSSSWAYLASQGHPKSFPTSAILRTLFGTDTDDDQLSLQPEYFMAWGARNATGNPNGADNPSPAPGFEWVSEMRDGGACQAGGP